MTFVAIVAMAYLAWAALLFATQRAMMFPGTALRPALDANALPAGVERFWIAFSGGRAEAWFVAAPGPARSPAVIFAHGNGELIENGLEEAGRLRDLGLSTLLVEYPGYGRSDGAPSRAAIAEVFLAAYALLVSRPDVDAGRIVGMGRSLGAGPITDLAGERPLAALVLISAFTSVGDLARRYFVPGVLARDAFDNAAVLRTFEGPVLVVHGRRDDVIPYAHGERLAQIPRTATLLSLDCAHNDCPPDPHAYRDALETFLLDADVLQAGSAR